MTVALFEMSITMFETENHMFENNEIFVDTLSPETKRFLSLEISGDPSLIELEVSGLVDGRPLAAVPREAISFDGE